MIGEKKQIIFLFWLFCLQGLTVFSQDQTSKDNYTGAWQEPSSWNPEWPVPLTSITGSDAPTITINGNITVDNSLIFNGNATNLIVNDTLIIKGDLSIDNNNDLTINDNGILIVWGNLSLSNQTQIITNGYLIVVGNVYKGGTVFHGSWTSNDNPVKLYIGGTLPASLSDNVPNYPALNCAVPVTASYTNTGCSYGNMTDLAGDPISVLLQENCSITNVRDTLQTCVTSAINLSSSYATTYTWSGPNGFTSTLKNPIIPNANTALAGDYIIIVTNAICTDKDTINVIVNPLPETPTITASGPTAFCAGGNVTLTSSVGTGYIWSTGTTTESINVNLSGSYSVKVKNSFGCESAPSAVSIVTVNALPVAPTVTASGPTAFCAGESVTLTSSAESGYLWSTGATTQYINVTLSGSYSVRGISASGCPGVSSVNTIVTVHVLPLVTANNNGPLCSGSALNLTGGPEGMTSYSWTGPDGFTSLLQNPSLSAITELMSGIYTLSVTDANGCTTTASTTAVVNALPVVGAGSDMTIPNGTSTSIDATVTGTGPFTYSWSPSGQLINALIEDPATTILTTSTVFTLIATSTVTSCFNTDEMTITISGGQLSAVSSAVPQTSCAGEDVQLSVLASGGLGSYTYSWTSIPSGFTSSVVNPVVNPVVSTTYYVAVFDGFTTVNSQVVVTVNPLPPTPSISASGPTAFCAGGNVTLTSSVGTGYIWSTGTTTESINVNLSGSYSVKVKNSFGCESAPSAVSIVTVNALPVAPTVTASGPTAFCAGGSVTLTSIAESGYLWSTGETTQNINVTLSGSYSVRGISASGCSGASSVSTIVTVNVLPPVTANNNGPLCSGSALNLTGGPEGMTSYSWTGPDGFISLSQNPSLSASTDLMSGLYTLTVTDANGCTKTASTIAVVNTLPVVGAGSDMIIPNGTSTSIDATVTGTGPFTYSWSPSGQLVNAFIEDPATTILTTSTVFTLIATSTATSCFNSDEMTITVNGAPLSAITTAVPETSCAGDDVQLSVLASGGSGSYTYSWTSIPSGFTSSVVDPVVNPIVSTTYYVAVFDGFTTVNSQVAVIVKALPSATAGSNSPVCAGNIITLTSSGGITYKWKGPDSFESDLQSPSIPNAATAMAGSYTVTVTNGNGCAVTTTTNIFVNDNPVAIAGQDQELKFISETEMKAELSSSETGEWSLLSGTGLFDDIHSPVSGVTELSLGENIFLWKVRKDGCEDTTTVKIIVYDPFIPSVITPNGDGKNDYFVIGEIIDKVEIIIFNRWGNEEYSNANYLNDWDGRNNKGRELPNDTYFYILKFGNIKIKNGSVLIKR